MVSTPAASTPPPALDPEQASLLADIRKLTAECAVKQQRCVLTGQLSSAAHLRNALAEISLAVLNFDQTRDERVLTLHP